MVRRRRLELRLFKYILWSEICIGRYWVRADFGVDRYVRFVTKGPELGLDIDAENAAECDEFETSFDGKLKKIAKTKLKPEKKAAKK